MTPSRWKPRRGDAETVAISLLLGPALGAAILLFGPVLFAGFPAGATWGFLQEGASTLASAENLFGIYVAGEGPAALFAGLSVLAARAVPSPLARLVVAPVLGALALWLAFQAAKALRLVPHPADIYIGELIAPLAIAAGLAGLVVAFVVERGGGGRRA